jgi:hypothetical protein
MRNTNHFDTDETRGEALARLAPAVLILLMTAASWVGVFVVIRNAAQYAPSAQTSNVETIYESMGGR